MQVVEVLLENWRILTAEGDLVQRTQENADSGGIATAEETFQKTTEIIAREHGERGYLVSFRGCAWGNKLNKPETTKARKKFEQGKTWMHPQPCLDLGQVLAISMKVMRVLACCSKN